MATYNLTIDFNNGAGNASTIYDDGAATNPTTPLFTAATVSSPSTSNNANLKVLVLQITNPSSTMTFGLTTAAQTAAAALGITSIGFDSTTGRITFSATAANSALTDETWNTLLQGLTYKNSADETNGTTHTISVFSATPARASDTFNITSDVDVITITCFYPGTMIRTPSGEVAVETLKHGDLVLTHDGREIPVAWLARQTVSTVFADKARVLPIRIKAGALGENVPARDLLVSPDHAMFVDGVLIHAGALVNDTSIVRETNVPTTFTYYHVEVADHSLILAEGAAAETFVDNVDRLGFDNWREYEALYPEGKTVEELPYPRAKSRRQIPVSIRVALAARAEAIGAVSEATAVA